MRVLSYLEASVTWTASWDEVRPLAGAAHGVVLEFLQKRYSFASASQSPSSQATGFVTPFLQIGSFEGRSPPSPIGQIDFQPAAIVVSSSTTEAAIEIFDDVMSSLESEFGFRTPPDRPRKYASTIVSQLDFRISEALSKWSGVLDFIKKYQGDNGSTMAPVSVRFMALDGGQPSVNQFTFERRFPIIDGDERIFTLAPLSTTDHELLLQHIETIFGKA
ncbi:MAG: hypothetical protein WDN46_12055 [Methylocella sp.]